MLKKNSFFLNSTLISGQGLASISQLERSLQPTGPSPAPAMSVSPGGGPRPPHLSLQRLLRQNPSSRGLIRCKSALSAVSGTPKSEDSQMRGEARGGLVEPRTGQRGATQAARKRAPGALPHRSCSWDPPPTGV